MRYWANAIALNDIGKPTRLFTSCSVDNPNKCEETFANWEKNYGYKFLISWIDKEDDDGNITIISKTEYSQNLM